MPEPYTPAELEAACKAIHELEDMTVDRYLSVKQEVAAAFRAVLPDHDARVRADERARVAEEIAAAIEAKADAHNALIAEAAGVPNRGRDGMQAFGIRSGAAIARAHATTPTTEEDPNATT